MTGTQRRIDSAVHIAPPPLEQLLPYLSDHWATYVSETFLAGTGSGTGRLHGSAGMSFTYPAWAPSLALDPEATTLPAIQTRILSSCERAVLHCYGGAEAFTHPYYAAELARAVNRWLGDEWLQRDERLRATAVIAPQYTESAADEVHRIGDDDRFVALSLPARSTEPYGNQRYWPIWDAASAHGKALAISYGGASLTPPTPLHWPSSFFELYVDAPLVFGTHLASLVFSGIFERCPDLRVVLVESGWTWLPALLWRMDWEWKGARREVPWLKMSPSDYVRRHVRITTSPCDAPDDLAQLGQVIAQLGSDEMLMYGSDHPHEPELGLDELLSLLSPEHGERVLWRNAGETYRLAGELASA